MKKSNLLKSIAAATSITLLSSCLSMELGYYKLMSNFSEKYSYDVRVQKERMTAGELDEVFWKPKDEDTLVRDLNKKLEMIADDSCIKKRLSEYLTEEYFPKLLHQEHYTINYIAESCMIDVLFAKQAKYPQ